MKKKWGHINQVRYGYYRKNQDIKPKTRANDLRKKRLKVIRIRQRLFLEQAGRCHYCDRLCCLPKGRNVDSDSQPEDWFTLEHILPVSKGGETSYTNCVGACKSCNSKRNVGSVQKFIQKIKPKIEIADPVIAEFDKWFLTELSKFRRDVKSIFKVCAS